MSERTSVCKLPDNYDTVVVGGGFYGCTLALNRARSLSERTLLVECGNELLGRASYVNQARVHMGYHYPRSLLTGYRSRANFERFVNEFRDCVERDFTSYYAVARLFSKVTAGQFALFCRRIDAPLTEAPPEVVRLFNPNLVESVFTATEAVFNASKLRHRMRTQLAKYGVEVLLRSKVEKVHCISSGILGVEVRNGVTSTRLRSRRVFNCTYSQLNEIVTGSELPPVPLKHRLAELAIVKVPPPLERVGITVMCGPFFSLIPFPPLGLHTLSHVRYTHQEEWSHESQPPTWHPQTARAESSRRSHAIEMICDASRFVPLLRDCAHVDSLWEIKTVLPRNQVDDGRPILIKQHDELRGFYSILGSKIDNVYDMIDSLSTMTER